MEGSPLGSRRRDEPEFTLKEWNLKGRISRENTMASSRRFSGSYIRSFREESNNRSFRSNITISSTASSPGYHLKDEIDPSTYSFTTALKALQARSGYVWECLSPEGFALNSKWHEAEKYICNPQSGQFPTECLSSKSLSGRSFHSIMAGRVSMSVPLVYSSRRFNNCPKPPMVASEEKDHEKTDQVKTHFPLQAKENEEGDRDKSTRRTSIKISIPPDESPCSISYSSSPLPPNKEESSNCCDAYDEKDPSSNTSSMDEVEAMKATKEEEEDTKRGGFRGQHLTNKQNPEEKPLCMWPFPSWRSCLLWRRGRHKSSVQVKNIHPSVVVDSL